MPSKQKLFITGGGGFLGESLVEELKNSYDIILLAQEPRKNATEHVVRGSLENIGEWKDALIGIDIIIHLAGITHTNDVALYHRVNAERTRQLVETAQTAGVKRFIFVSTRAYRSNCGAYGISKKKAEDYVKLSMLRYTILRVAETYDDVLIAGGGGQRLGAVAQMAKLVEKSFFVPYLADSRALLAPVHKDDVLRSIIGAVENEAADYKTYTIAGPETLSIKEVVQRIIKQRNLKRILIPIPTPIIRPALFIIFRLLHQGTSDQLARLLCKKDPLSEEAITDLHMSPRPFLITRNT